MENNSKSFNKPLARLVYLRCVFIKIFKVDTVNEFYSAEIFLQSKWREPLLDNKSDLKDISLSSFWNPKISVENIFMETKSSISHEVSYSGKAREAYITEKRRVSGGFREVLELQHFPFDCQDLSITVSTEYPINEVKMLECPHDLSKLNTIDGMESQEWNLYEHVEVESKTVINDCNIGPRERQTMTFTCRASRRFKYFLINHIMISSMFFLLTFTSFSIEPQLNTYYRLGLCMTTLLTSVTFKVAVSQNLPKIPYLTYLDKTILGNIVMIMCLCIWHASTSLFFLTNIFSTNNTVTKTQIEGIEKYLIPSLVVFYGLAILAAGLTIYFDLRLVKVVDCSQLFGSILSFMMEFESKSNHKQLKKLVYLRCVFVKIYKVDTINEFYSGDIFLQAKWREPLLDDKADMKDINLSTFWNPKLIIENMFQETKSSISHEVSFSEKGQQAYLTEKRRIKACFRETLELQHFPFDCQDLSIPVATEYSINEVKLVELPHDLSKLNTIDGMESQEWNLYEHVEVESKTIINECNIGPRERQIMTFTCRASRKFKYFLINHIMISSMFFLLTFTSFSINPGRNTFFRLGLCMTTLLTSVTFKVAVSQNLPKIPYLTYLDKTILGNILMIMSLCIWHACTSLFFKFTTTDDTSTATVITTAEQKIIPCLLGFYTIAILVSGLTIYFDAGKRRREMLIKDAEFAEALAKIEAEKLFCEVC